MNKLTKATVDGNEVYQTTNDQVKSHFVETDINGVATFTVSGTNTKATPVAFIDDGGYIGGDEKDNKKVHRTELQVTAKELTFGAIHAKYELEITRDGAEEAAEGEKNGRLYKIVVKDENGKAAANEVVNVGLDEVLDRVISTNTDAKFIVNADSEKGTDYYDEDLVGKSKFTAGSNKQQITVELNSKGEGEFKIVGSDKDYATPVMWIDINSSDNKQGVLEEGEPFKKAAMTYFATEKVAGSALKVYEPGTTTQIKDNRTINAGTNGAEFKFTVANQSGKTIAPSKVEKGKATFKVENTGTKDVVVFTDKAYLDNYLADKSDDNRNKGTVISTKRTTTLKSIDLGYHVNAASIFVASVDGQSATVEVTAYGEATEKRNDKDTTVTLSESKVAKATFKSSGDLNDSETRLVTKFKRDDKKITFQGKAELNFKDEYDAGKVRYIDARGTSDRSLGFNQFADEIVENVTVIHYFKDSDGVITFKIVNAATGGETGTALLDNVNIAIESGSVTQVKVALRQIPAFAALSDADQTIVATNVEANGAFANADSLNSFVADEIRTVNVANVVTAANATGATYADLVTAVGKVAGAESSVAALRAETNTAIQNEILSVVGGLTAGNIDANATVFNTAITNAIATAKNNLNSNAVTAAMLDVNTKLLALDATQNPANYAAAEKAIKDNAAVLGLDLTGYNALPNATAREAALLDLANAAEAANSGVGFGQSAALNGALQAAVDVTAPKVVKAVYNDVTEVLTLTFSENVNINSAITADIDFNTALGGTGTVAATSVSATGKVVTMTLTTPSAVSFESGVTITDIVFSVTGPVVVDIEDAKGNVSQASDFVIVVE